MEKVIISDLDGTLLNDDGSVPDSFIELIEYTRKNNIQIYFASSRSPQNIKHLFAKYNFQYNAICSDGATLVSVKENSIGIITELNLSTDQVINTVKELLPLRLNPLFFTNHSNDYKIICKDTSSIELEVLEKLVSDGRKIIKLKNLNDFLNSKEVNCVRAISFFDKSDIIEEISAKIEILPSLKLLKVYKYTETRFFQDQYAWIDIMPKNLSKGMLVKSIQKNLLINKFIIALGNGVNDIELFQTSNMSFCPENSHQLLKELSTYGIKKKNGEEFIREVINHLRSFTYE